MTHIFKIFLLMPSLVGFGRSFMAAQQQMDPEFKKTIDGLLQFDPPTISCQELNAAIQAGKKIYLLDAREAKEYEVSHIKGAKYLGYNHPNLKNIMQLPKDALIVVYCSIGYRSEQMGKKLRTLGLVGGDKLRNLYGGIFEWSNLGYPIVSGAATATKRVHAYDAQWGRWLKLAEKVYN